MIHRVQAHINLQALQANFRVAKTHFQHKKVIAVVKANAYGHGLIPVAEALANDADAFAVTDINEALILNKAQINKPILILQSICDPKEIKLVAEHGFHLVIHSLSELPVIDDILSSIKLNQALTFWLKLDSGMGRLGITSALYSQAFQALQKKPYTHDVILMTHLANASQPNSELNQQQLQNFRQVQESLALAVSTSIPASSGLLSHLDVQSSWARPGIMLYGSSPFSFQDETLRRDKFNLQAVMTLESKIIAIRQLKAGDNVGYCSQFICPKDMSIGIVSIGYADGYPSNAPNGTPVLVNGKRSSTTGRVSMDMIAIDLSDIPEAVVGDKVILWGDDLSVDEVAEHTGILSYNLTCSISSRVRLY